MNFFQRWVGQFFLGLPGMGEGGFNSFGREIQIGDKFQMRTVSPVLGLVRRHEEQTFHQREIAVQQQGPVEEQIVSATALRVAGKLQIANAKV